MKRILVILPLVIVITFVGAILAFNMGVFHKQVELEASRAAGAKVQLGKIQLVYSWPPQLSIGSSEIDHPVGKIRWTRLRLRLLRMSAPYSVSVFVQDPTLALSADAAQTQTKSKTAKPSPASEVSSQKPIHLKLEIKNGELESPFGKLTGLDLSFEQQQLLKSPAKVALGGVLTAASFPVPLPVKLDSDSLTVSADVVKSPNAKFAIGGLDATISGESWLTEGRHRWLLNLAAPDLAELPQPPVGIPAKNWRGGVRAKVEVRKLSDRASWSAEGEVQAKEVNADVDFKQGLFGIHGSLALNSETKFSYLNEKLNVHSLNAALNLAKTRVEYEGLLSKPAGVALNAHLIATGDPTAKLTIAHFELKLWDLIAQAKGMVELKAPWPGQLQVAIQPVNLTGAERWLVPLRASPVKGQLAMSFRLNGPLGTPMATQVIVDNLKLKGFSATVDYEKPGAMQLRGPLRADIEGKGEFTNGRLKSAQGNGSADLSSTAFVLGPLRKEAGSKFQGRFQVRNEGQSLKIDAFDLNSFFGVISMRGSVENPARPQVDLALNLKPLLLGELRIAIPEYREKIPKGTLNSSLKLKGRLEFERPWHEWPLLITGSVALNLPEYMLAPQAAPTGQAPNAPSGKTPAEAPPEPFLPKGELTSKMRLGVRAQVATLIKSPDKFEGVALDGQIANGKLIGAVSIKSIFGGGVEVRALTVPLLDPKPIVQGSATWVNLNIRDVLLFSKPEFKDFASGISAGQTDFTAPMPGVSDLMSAVKARGEMNLSPVTFSTLKVGDLINTFISKVPMLKIEPVKVEPLTGEMKLKYELAGGVLNVISLEGQDVDGSAIQMKGKIALTAMQGDLVGTFAWAEPKVKGCLLEGNADTQGRMVIPMAIKGDLMSPGMSIVSDVAKKLASRALECEKDKAVEKLKRDGKKKLEDEVKKKLKGLLGG